MYPTSIHLMSTAVPGTVPGVSNTAPAFINPQAQAQGQGGQFVYVPRRGDACCDQVIGQNRLIDELNRVLSAPAAVPCGCKGGFGACQPTENKVGALYDAMLKYYTNNAQEAPEEETVEDRLDALEASVAAIQTGQTAVTSSLEAIAASLTTINASLVAIDGRLDALEAPPA